MFYTNLKENPDYYKDTIKLIEKSFNYSNTNHFDIDFYPLVGSHNHQNCHLIIKDNKVIAHIGVLLKNLTINDKKYPIAMYGGISVDESYRGQGHFKDLFMKVLSLYQNVAIHLLWSDQLELYQSFDFFPAIEQIEFDQSLEDAEIYRPTKLSLLDQEEMKQLEDIYNNSQDLRLERTSHDWSILKKIHSSDLYLKKENNRITNYFFMNKGEDLNGVIIEIGNYDDIEEIVKYGITWSPFDFGVEDVDHLYASVVRIGETNLFKSFIEHYTKEQIKISEFNKEKIIFSFEESSFSLSPSEFLTGVFGPSRFDELKHLKPIYISGLDSI